MIAVISYKSSVRVVLILGTEGNKFYFLASEKVPEEIAQTMAAQLSKLQSLGKKIEFLKDNYGFVYKSAFRSVPAADVQIVEKYG